MRRVIYVLLSAIAVLALLYGVYWLDLQSRTYHFNQKLTVTVSTQGGDVADSSVSRVDIQHYTKHDMAGQLGYARQLAIRGEATVVELAPGRYLFALIQEENELLAYKTFLNVANPEQPDSIKLTTTHYKGFVKQSDYPMLVTFADINNPKSVQLVKPADFAASFGPGFALKSIALEITDEKVTEGVVITALPWIRGFNGAFVPSTMKPADQYTLGESMSVDKFFIGMKP